MFRNFYTSGIMFRNFMQATKCLQTTALYCGITRVGIQPLSDSAHNYMEMQPYIATYKT